MIEATNLAYAYPAAKRPVLEGLHFHIQKGEIFGFLGPSGAGKSTTQQILIGKLKKYSGSARVLGQEIRSANAAFYERIGVAYEFPHFYNRFTALENLQHFRSLYRNQLTNPVALLNQVGLEDAAHKKVETFSKGMKMRLNYCRSVLNNPELLFLDEPTSGLDPVHADNLKRLIEARRQAGATIVITTHNMQAAEQLCDRVAFMMDGQIRFIDSPRNLKLLSGERKVRVEYEFGEERATEDFPLEGIGSNERYLSLIRSHRIITMHTLEASLEDIFIAAAGSITP
ncbi:fluoroquinolone transport system ATP-binding protein [Paenibacillus algorifonticola]|uniref:Fluoroquinolone transport system ATP-binding protein n=1 Tax=Paenibacillus algorifonticola TaxID=684063 RepID=A0A1I2I247_9BACL|nr:ABC transporter ATP-binding protein [Paenibacillus algorifonticola]SFF34601.1 fluoroquinolone transport system ATP-binding protein [Paenibacillus algorifonticola]